MDIILKSHLKQFCDQYGYDEKSPTSFELFTIYSVASKYVRTETISKDMLENLNTGDGGDWGIDGIVVIVNGKIITTKQEVNDLLDANGSLNVTFLITQSKTSANKDLGDFCKTMDGVEFLLKDVLGDNNLPKSNEDMTEYRELIKHIYTKNAYLENGINPKLRVFYVNSGRSDIDDVFKAKIEKTRKFIESTSLISDVSIDFLGSNEIVSLFKETKSRHETTIKVTQKLALPEVDKVQDSYLCLIPFVEYKKLITDEEGNIIDSVFYDNIRAYQGDNAVNKSIAETLRKGNISLFTAMNNGITIIAKKIGVTGNSIHLIDYQIVNGCQTSNVLQRNAAVKNIDNLVLVVKLIASQDKEVRDSIIVGNNSQTEVKREQLVSLLETQRSIEDYYNAQNKYEKLYYERRSKQYKTDAGKVPASKVITIPFQIKAFIAMILGKPEQVSGYYGSIVDNFEKNGIKVFSADVNPCYYYTSALASYKMTEAFSHDILPKRYKQVRFHLLLAFRLMTERTSLPATNSNKSQTYCDYICDVLCDKERCNQAFKNAVKLVDYTLKHTPRSLDRFSKKFTDNLFKTAKNVNERCKIMVSK